MARLAILLLVCLKLTDSAAQSIKASPAKSKDLYQWIENPLKIEAGHLSCNAVVVKAGKGKIEGSRCDRVYIALSDTIHTDTIKAGFRKAGRVVWLSTGIYNIRSLPDPLVTIAGKINGPIARNILSAQLGLMTPNFFSFEATQSDRIGKLKSYSVMITRNSDVVFSEAKVDGCWLSRAFLEFIRAKSKAGDEITFDHFVCLMYEHEIRPIKQRITLTIK